MTKLAAIEDLRSLLRFDEITEVNTIFDAALEAATSDLESRLRTDFAEETRFDIFQLTPQNVNPYCYQYHWRLKNGFVNSSDTFTVRAFSTFDDLTNGSAIDITSQVVTDYKSGVVSLLGGIITSVIRFNGYDKIPGNFVRVDYTSGWVDDDDDGVYDTVPDWLKQACMLRAISHVDTINPNLRRNNSKQTRVQPDLELSVVETLYVSLIQKHIRYHPKYSNPIVKS